jgi:hypothetical protein
MARFLPPSAIVHSGAGLHCYWFLNAPLELSVEAAERAKALLRRLANLLRGDLGAAEAAGSRSRPTRASARRATSLIATSWRAKPGKFMRQSRSRFRATNPYATFGQILSDNVLKSPMTFAVGVLNGGHSNGRVKPASFSLLRLSVICSTVPIRILLPFPVGV